MNHYILKGKTPVRTNLQDWSENWWQNRVIGNDVTHDGVVVSTVFLGLDHNFFGDGDPILFETMTFPPEGHYNDEDMERYRTYDDAVAGHQRMLEKYGGKKEEFDPDYFDESLFEVEED